MNVELWYQREVLCQCKKKQTSFNFLDEWICNSTHIDCRGISSYLEWCTYIG